MTWCTTLDTIILEQHCTLTSQSVGDTLKAKAMFKTSDFSDALVLGKSPQGLGAWALSILWC